MQALLLINPDLSFPTLEAERLATAFMYSATDENVFELSTPDRSARALLYHDRLLSEVRALAAFKPSALGAVISLKRIDAEPTDSALLSRNAGAAFQDWGLSLHATEADPFAHMTGRHVALYVISGLSIIVVIAALAVAIARYLFKQIRLTRMRNDFVSLVSHELKTPITSMRVLVDTLLEDGIEDQTRCKEYLELIHHEHTRLTHLVEQFLTFSRMERQKYRYEMQPVHVSHIIESAATVFTSRNGSTKNGIALEIEPTLPNICADREAMITVVRNLLDNAYKYSNPPHKITLRAFKRQGHVCIAVSDNGIGLSKNNIKRVGSQFYQVDQRLNRQGSGIGLGLSIVKNILREHGAKLNIESQLGEGSVFTVQIPMPTSPSIRRRHHV